MRCLPLLALLCALPLAALGQDRPADDPKAGPPGIYDKTIDRGLQFLIRRQDPRKGDFGGGMYGHGLATLAVCEAYGLTGDPQLRDSAQRAINYLVYAQHPTNGGWRYAPGQEGDASVTGWQVMALRCAEMGGLKVPKQTMLKATHFINGVMNAADKGYGYTGPGSSPTMTAVGLLCRQKLQGWGPGKLEVIEAVKKHLQPMQPNERALQKNVYFYFYATQVMRSYGGEPWEKWNKALRDGLIQTQEKDPASPNHGSWSSVGDPYGGAGGRLMVTSLNLLTLEVYYRYPPDGRHIAVDGGKNADPLSWRSRARRMRALAAEGGTEESEAAVARGLKWLARNQSPDGHWAIDGAFRDKGSPNDVAGTALGLLPLLGMGHSHKPLRAKLLTEPAAPDLSPTAKEAQRVERAAEARQRLAHAETVAADLRSSTPKTRRAAIKAAAELHEHGGSAAAPLVAILADKDDRNAAVDALVSIGKPAVPALIKGLDNKNVFVRLWSAHALGRIGSGATDAAGALQACARSDTSISVREAAQKALAKVRK